MKSLATHHKAAFFATGCSLVLAACGGGTPTPMLDDGGILPTGDGGMSDSTVSDFDASTMYPGEGDACRLSMECGDRQICVDDACIRHERIDPAEVQLGEWRLASEEASRAVDLRNDDEEFRNDMMVLVPGRTHPVVVSTGEFEEGCRLARVDREWASTRVPGVDCLSVDSTSDGGFVIGAAQREDQRPMIVVLANDLSELSRIEIDADVVNEGRITLGLGARLGGVTGILVDGADVLASVGVFSRDGVVEHDGVIVVRIHEDGTQTLARPEIMGGRGWLVRDASGVSVVTTEWPWDEPPVRGAPDRRSLEFRYRRTDLQTGEMMEEYLGSAQTAWLFRPQLQEWSIALFEQATPGCQIRSFGPNGLEDMNLSEESILRRECLEAGDAHPTGYDGATNHGRSSLMPTSLFGWSDGSWSVIDLGWQVDEAGVEQFGFVDQSTMAWIGFDGEQSFFAPVGTSFSRFGITQEAFSSWNFSDRLGIERRLVRR